MSEEKKDKEKEKGKSKGINKKVIIFIIVGVLLIGGGGFAGYYFIFAKKAAAPANTASSNGMAVAGQVQQTSIQTAVIPKLTVDFDEFITNLADEGGKRYIKITISLGYDNSKLTKEFDEKKNMIRDAINSVLRTKKFADLTTEKGLEDLKVQILNRVNPLLENGRALNVYFSNIVMQ